MSTPHVTQPLDQPERDRVTRQTATTMFVEAGAGTGKTSALVARVLELVTGPDAVPIGSIAAITFTEKAAAELRNRIRAGLNDRLSDAHEQSTRPDEDSTGARGGSTNVLRDALDGLDSAAISTLHGFARRILAEHPIEAGLPPMFEALDEISSDVDFDERWSHFFDALLADPEMAWSMSILDAAGAQATDVRSIAAAFNDNWDRVRVGGDPPAAAPVDVDALTARGSSILARRAECGDPADPLLRRFPQLDAFLDRLHAARSDIERLAVLRDADDSRLGVPKVSRTGRAPNWTDVEALRADFAGLRDDCSAVAAGAIDDAIDALCHRIAGFTLDAAEQRRVAGRLEFHDLLVRARDLLRASAPARESLHHRYRHLLLDEFQDTDPIQVEIATLIAATAYGGVFPAEGAMEPVSANGAGGADAGAAGWRQLDTAPGQLFFVGDPKQSIYRFRRADIGLYLTARERFGSEIGEAASLSVNFRTTAPIIEWVNATFDALMADAANADPSTDTNAGHGPNSDHSDRPGTGSDVEPWSATGRIQASYAALAPSRPPLAGGPALVALGIDAHDPTASGLNAEGIRETEAGDIAEVISEMMRDGWQVYDRRLECERPARLSDIAVLVPTRTCLPQLEAGLAAASVPYRLEASEFVWRSRTVRDLMMCLRAAADPDDALAVVSALRTPSYGCGDDDLYVYYRAVGSWSYFTSDVSAVPGGDEHPVVQGLRHLRSLYDDHTLVPPAVLLERLLRERRVREQAAAGPRTRETWRHIRYVVDQARAWSQSQHGGLRKFLRWVEMQGSEQAKVTEAVLPESDDDSVRVMTVHASKGLEFPIVIVTGLQGSGASPAHARIGFTDIGQPHNAHDSAHRYGGAASVRLRKGVQTVTYEAWSDAERSAEHHERIRLLYVACTRARDRLIVSLHRPTPPKAGDRRNRNHAQIICDTMPNISSGHAAGTSGLWDYRDSAAAAIEPAGSPAPVAAPVHSVLPPRGEWARRRDAAGVASAHRSAFNATGIARDRDPESALAHGAETATETPDDHLGTGRAPARRGRGATAVGKATHGVLQAIDLTSGAELEGLAAAQAVAEGVAGRQRDIEAFVRSALASKEVAAAALGRHWREVYTAVPVGGPDSGSPAVVEGFIDLLYEDGESGELVVLDYKTDSLGVMPDVDGERAEQYRRQGAVYAWCIEHVTGKVVSKAVLLYLRDDDSPAQADALEGDELRRMVNDISERAASLVATG